MLLGREARGTVALVVLCQVVHFLTFTLLAVVALNAVFVHLYFGPLFLVPVEVLGQRMAGSATGFGNLFANIGACLSAFGLGVMKDKAGTFTASFFVLAALCVIGVALSFLRAHEAARAGGRAR